MSEETTSLVNTSSSKSTTASSNSRGHDMTMRSQIVKEKNSSHLCLYFDNDQSYVVIKHKYCFPITLNNGEAGTFFRVSFKEHEQPWIGKLITEGSKNECDKYIVDNDLTASAGEEKKRSTRIKGFKIKSLMKNT